MMTCADGSGWFVVSTVVPEPSDADADSGVTVGTWRIEWAGGDYANLTGSGDYEATDGPVSTWRYFGEFSRQGAYPAR